MYKLCRIAVIFILVIVLYGCENKRNPSEKVTDPFHENETEIQTTETIEVGTVEDIVENKETEAMNVTKETNATEGMNEQETSPNEDDNKPQEETHTRETEPIASHPDDKGDGETETTMEPAETKEQDSSGENGMGWA